MDKIISDYRKTARSRQDWNVERRRARERMRYVEPHNAGKILAHHRYWTVQFLELYLERCDETAFDVPSDAYLLAQHAPELARRIRISDKAGEYLSVTEKLSGIVLALAAKGSCCRAADEFDEAELCFRRAFRGLKDRKAAPVAMAELHRRYAALLATVRSREDASTHIERSLDYFREADDRAGHADALALRGYLRSEEMPGAAILDFIEASRFADLRSARGKRTARAALYNVIGTVAMGSSVSLRDQETALKVLQNLKNELKGSPTSVRKMKALWIEGLLLSNLQIDRHAERQLGKARKGFAGLGQAMDFAVISTEIVQFLISRGEVESAKRLAMETLDELQAMEASPSQLEIVRRWSQRAPTMESTVEAREQLMRMQELTS